MPSDSDAAQAKKPRKKPRSPQVIDEATWLAIEKAVCAGMGFSEASRAFNIRSPHAIIMRSRLIERQLSNTFIRIDRIAAGALSPFPCGLHGCVRRPFIPRLP